MWGVEGKRDFKMVTITTAGSTVTDALEAFGANLEAADTDTLLAELRHRLASEDAPRVLRILPFAETEMGKATAKVIAAAKTRKKKA
jgi:hypothetical protein